MSMDIQQPYFSQNKYGIPATTVPQSTPNANGMVNDFTFNIDRDIQKLERELAEVDARIAEFDRLNPGVASGDIGIAAKRAEAGDMSAYDNLVNGAMAREQMGSSNVRNAEQSIRNAIGNARNAIAGHERMQAYEKGQAFDLARVQLDEAKYLADKAGMNLPKEYYDVENIIGKGIGKDSQVVEEWLNNEYTARAYLDSLVRNDKLTMQEIKKLNDYADQQYDDELALKFGNLANEYKRKTNESKNARKERKKAADAEAAKFSGVLDVDERIRRYGNGSKELKEFYSMDAKGNLTQKGAR